MDPKDMIAWYTDQLTPKKIKVQSLKDLKSGSLFLETLHIHYPKYVDLTKIYLKPKNSFEVLQNYRLLMNVFGILGWKKYEAQKYVKQQDKDCIDIGNVIMKKLVAVGQNQNSILMNNNERKSRKAVEGDFMNSMTLLNFNNNQNNNNNINTNLDKSQSFFENQQSEPNEIRTINQLSYKKQKLLNKIMSIQHIVNEGHDVKLVKNMINKILQQ